MARKKERASRLSARKTAETHQSGFSRTTLSIPDGLRPFQLKAAGTRRINVLPYTAGEGNPNADAGSLYFERTFWAHRGIGVAGEMYVCPRKTIGKPCPICEARAKMAKDPNADEELIADLSPKERQLWLVQDADKPEDGPLFWEVSYHLFGKQLYAEIKNSEDDDDFEFFADPESGFTLRLGIEEKKFGGNTFYSVETVNFKARKAPLDSELLEDLPCLDDMVKILPYDELRAIFLQEEGDDEDEDDEEPKRKAKAGTKSKPKPKPAEDDDDEDEDDDPPPPKSKSKSKPKPKPADDDDDDEDDDYEEYEQPKAKKPAADKKKKWPLTAEKAGLSEGDEVEYEGELCVILKISKDGTSLTLEGSDSGEEYGPGIGCDEVSPPPKPKPKAGKPAAGKKKTVVEDDDDEDDDDEDEEAPPRKKAGKKSSKKDVEDDDEDEDDDPPPKKKAAGKKSKSKDDEDDDDWSDWEDD